jgi:hypothetical protein
MSLPTASQSQWSSIAFALFVSDDRSLPEGELLLELNENLYGRYSQFPIRTR